MRDVAITLCITYQVRIWIQKMKINFNIYKEDDFYDLTGTRLIRFVRLRTHQPQLYFTEVIQVHNAHKHSEVF